MQTPPPILQTAHRSVYRGPGACGAEVNLLKWSGKRIILIPDRNKAGEKLLNQVHNLGWEVALISNEWGNDVEDCAEATKRFGKLYTLETILNNATTNSMKVKTFKTGLFRIKA